MQELPGGGNSPIRKGAVKKSLHHKLTKGGHRARRQAEAADSGARAEALHAHLHIVVVRARCACYSETGEKISEGDMALCTCVVGIGVR
jgi:hypothetical protein